MSISVLSQRFADLFDFAIPPYGVAAVFLLLLYAIQSEIRFGAKARRVVGKSTDRGSTLAVSLASAAPIIGFVIAMHATGAGFLLDLPIRIPDWLLWPGPTALMRALAWAGIGLGCAGLFIRLWSVLTLRKRYTRTLLVDDDHTVERGGPYRFVRHPGYFGSLLCLNAIALASCSVAIFATSVLATFMAYAYRVHVEDAMLVAAFGEEYERYRRDVGALMPFMRPRQASAEPVR